MNLSRFIVILTSTLTQPKRKKGKRRALYATRDIIPGEIFTSENIRSFRPSAGLSPKYYDQLIGNQAKRIIKRGDPLTESDL